MYMYMYMYMHMYMYMYIYMHVYAHMHMYMCIYLSDRTCMHLAESIVRKSFNHIHTHTHKNMYVRSRINTSNHECIDSSIHTMATKQAVLRG